MLESKRKAIIFFIIALILALTAGVLVLNKVKALNSNLGTMVKVAVANQDVASRALIQPQDIKLDEIPKKYLKDYHVTDIEDLKNKVSIVPLSAGDIITKNMLKQASSVVEENNRLITVMRSDRTAFDENLEALDRVDIVVSQRVDNKESTDYFMKDVKVARVSKEKNKFKGVQLEIPSDKVPELIHMQNYADSVRIIKANVGKEQQESPSAQEKAAQEKAAQEQAAKEKAEKEKAEKDKKEEKK